jgi:hypothetical protein
VHHAQLIGDGGLALERRVEAAGQRSLCAAAALAGLGETLEGVERYVADMFRRLEACGALGLTDVTDPGTTGALCAPTASSTTPTRRRGEAGRPRTAPPGNGWGDDGVDSMVIATVDRLAGADSQLLGAVGTCHVALRQVIRRLERHGGVVLRRSHGGTIAAASHASDIPFGDFGFSSEAWVKVEVGARGCRTMGSAAVGDDASTGGRKRDPGSSLHSTRTAPGSRPGGGGGGGRGGRVRGGNTMPVSPVEIGIAELRTRTGVGMGTHHTSLRSPKPSSVNTSVVGMSSPLRADTRGGAPAANKPPSPMCLLRDKLSARLKL